MAVTFINVRESDTGAIGRMAPRVGMVTNMGTIDAVGDGWVEINGRFMKSHYLFVDVDVASGTFSYPSGDSSITYANKASETTAQ
jgi:hypothetical protein